MFLEAVLKGYNFVEAPFDTELRKELSGYKEEELAAMLNNSRNVHNTTDILDRERLFRALEIEKYRLQKKSIPNENIFRNTPVLGIRFERKLVRERITARLNQRLKEGMVEEVQQLINSGISKDRLKMYGLEYKYITMFLDNELTYNQMVALLNTAIHQFAKRQMTWFRRMENKGINIFWLDGEAGLLLNLSKAIDYIKKY